MALDLIVGTAIVAFILLYFSFNIGEEHFIFRLLSIVFAFVLLMITGKAGVDSQTVCEPVVNSTLVSGNLTQYTYQTYCYSAGFATGTTFMKVVFGIFVLLIAYIIFYLGWYVFNKISDWWKLKRGGA